MRYVMVVCCVVGCLVMQAFGLDGSFYASGPKSKKAVALTFDDGPGPYTEKILAILKEANVKATFFMDGSQVEIRPKIAAVVLADGHEIGNHLYSHADLYHYKKGDPRELLVKELLKTDGIIAKAINVHSQLLRIPHGFSRQWARDAAKENHYTIINWTFGCDWNKMTSEKLAEAYIKNIHPGAIFLMHDGGKNRQTTAEALPKLIAALKQQGYTIEPVGELLKGYTELSSLKNVNDKKKK